MLTLQEAYAFAEARLSNSSRSPDGESLVILREATIEREFGWVFFYNSYDFVQTGNPIHALAGNGPVIVNRWTGAVEQCGSAHPVEHYISQYERRAIQPDA